MSFSPTRSGGLGLVWFTLRRLLDWLDPQRPCPPCPPERTTISFVPGQLCLLAEYPAGARLDPAAIVRQVRDGLAQRELLNEDLILPAERVVVLRGRTRTLATLFGDMPAAQKDPERLLRFVTQINKTLADSRPPYEQGKPYDPDQQTADTAALGALSEQPAQPAPWLRFATPNWLTGGAPKNMGGGGPGAWPIPATPAAGTPWQLNVTMPPIPSPAPEQPVTIALLDTAPPEAAFTYAYDAWVGSESQPPTSARNELLASLIAPSGTLDLSGAGRLQVTRTGLVGGPDASFTDHDYEMSDHGLFVAGLIHSLAPPSAKLHLIEVLNNYGLGTIESIAHGFQVLLDSRTPTSGPLVVNCSLVINIPQPDVEAITNQAADAPDVQSLSPELVEQMSLLPAEIFDLVAQLAPQQNVAIVAAAGNDGGAGRHPMARFPAAYDGIVGVGALNSAGVSADYTNQADDPPVDGFATFGGDIIASTAPGTPDMTDATGGVLGLYIGKLPTATGWTQSSTGWARWAGTSFAAPIIGGVIAQRLGLGETISQALAAVESVSTPMSPTGPTIQVGDTFSVTQG
jgi:hypothetical protein